MGFSQWHTDHRFNPKGWAKGSKLHWVCKECIAHRKLWVVFTGEVKYSSLALILFQRGQGWCLEGYILKKKVDRCEKRGRGAGNRNSCKENLRWGGPDIAKGKFGHWALCRIVRTLWHDARKFGHCARLALCPFNAFDCMKYWQLFPHKHNRLSMIWPSF